MDAIMGVLMGTGALMLWLDVAPELDRETDAWYIDEHMPERIDVGGYLRARRYVAIEGTPAYLTLFEAQTPSALASDGYLRLVSRISAQSQRIRGGFSNVVRNTFEVRQSRGRGIGAIVASLRLTPRDAARAAAAAAVARRAGAATAAPARRGRRALAASGTGGARSGWMRCARSATPTPPPIMFF